MFLHSSRLLYSSICIYFHLSVFFHIFLCFLSISLTPYVFLSRSLTSLALYYSSVLLPLRTSIYLFLTVRLVLHHSSLCTWIVTLSLSLLFSTLTKNGLASAQQRSLSFQEAVFLTGRTQLSFARAGLRSEKKRALKKETHSHFWSSLFWSAASLSSIKIGTVGGRPISAVIMPLIAWLIVGRSIRRN